MDTPMRKELSEDDPEFRQEFEAELMAMDDAAARRHLAAGRPIYICEEDTPAGCVIKVNPDGKRQIVKHSRNYDEVIAEL